MAIELKMLAWAIALGLLQIAIAASFSTVQRGLAWNTSPRDTPAAPLTGVGGRIDRAYRNMLETFPYFAAAVLAVIATQKTSAHTALGAELYLGARVVYVGIYAAGIPYLRTLVWTASMVGIVMVLLALF